MECKWLTIADGWDLEVHYRPKLMAMEAEIVMVYLTSPDCESLNITDIWEVLVPNLVGQIATKSVFNTKTDHDRR